MFVLLTLVQTEQAQISSIFQVLEIGFRCGTGLKADLGQKCLVGLRHRRVLWNGTPGSAMENFAQMDDGGQAFLHGLDLISISTL